MLVCALLFCSDAQASAAVLLKGEVLSIRPSHEMLVRLKVDAVLAGRWQGRFVVVRLARMAMALKPGTSVYVVLKRNSRGRLRSAAWDFTGNGVCLTPKQQAEYGIDPARLPAAERCNPE
jgi:hypothetical protein